MHSIFLRIVLGEEWSSGFQIVSLAWAGVGTLAVTIADEGHPGSSPQAALPMSSAQSPTQRPCVHLHQTADQCSKLGAAAQCCEAGGSSDAGRGPFGAMAGTSRGTTGGGEPAGPLAEDMTLKCSPGSVHYCRTASYLICFLPLSSQVPVTTDAAPYSPGAAQAPGQERCGCGWPGHVVQETFFTMTYFSVSFD